MLSIALTLLSAAQAPAGAVAFRQACLDAGADAVVLNVAAHPDDEAARTMVYLRRNLGVRTVALFTTCGEGGQNAVGRDIGRALARRRVLETRAAAEHTGLEVRWLGFEDFGFSKTLEETLKVWGAEALEEAMLRALREIGPDVVLTNHDTERGHGHHRASAWAIQRAVVRFAQEIGRPVPLYQRAATEEEAPTFMVDVSRLDPVSGKTFARQAHEGLLEHASQGPWGPHDPARVRPERWKRVGDGGDEDPFAALPSAFDRPDEVARLLDLDGEDVEQLRAQLASLRDDLPRTAHLATARGARTTLGRLAAAARPAGEPEHATRSRLMRRLEALERVWLHGHGVSIEAYALRRDVPPFGRTTLRIAVHAGEPALVQHLRVVFQGIAGEPAADGALGELVRDVHCHLLPPGVGGERNIDPVTGARVLRPEVTFELAGLAQSVSPRVHVLVRPSLQLAWDRDVCVLPRGADGARRVLSLDVDYHGDGEPAGRLQVESPAGVVCELRPAELSVNAERRDARALLRVSVPIPARLPPDAALVARYGDSEARLPLRAVDVEIPPDLRVGLVRGPDDTLVRTLQDLGVPHTELDERTLAVAELGDFSTLVLDMRTSGNRPDLHDHRARLHEFCARGGRIVAFYHKPREWNARDGRPALFPHELVVGNERVCEEDAGVTILVPDHPLLTKPHPILAADFDGWVQERGLNFPETWDAAWTPLLRMADTGEEPLDGALLACAHGEGSFVFCSLALYRQWRTGHQGALRLLINLLTP